MKKICLIGIFFVLIGFICFADEENTTENTTEKTEEINSLSEDRRATLKYGINSEVVDVINKLIEEENKDFADDIISILLNSTNSRIVDSGMNYLIKIENNGAKDFANSILLDWENQETEMLSAAIRYLSSFHDESTEEIILPLVENENKILASSALNAIGKCGKNASAEKLLDLLEDDDYDENLKQDILKALGEMKSEIAIDVLIDIMNDVDEEKSWRWIACEALGKIAHSDALPDIKNALNDEDIYLRSYAVKALTNFNDAKVEDTLIQSLRDDFWKVRLSATEALGERKSTKAIEILEYKAEKDPEINVKMSAIEALGKIGTEESYEFLRNLYNKSNTSTNIRTKTAQIIIENDLDNSFEKINETIKNEWEKDKSALLNYTCKFLCKEKNEKLSPLLEKMLDHKDITIKIYGIRGIATNGFANFKDRLEELDNDKTNMSVRKAALDALEKLK